MSMKELRIKFLDEMGITYESKNNGEHLVIGTLGGIIDYWPSSGKFHDRATAFRSDGHSQFEALLKNRIGGLPVTVRSVSRPVEATVDPRDQRIAELEDLLGTAWDLLISDDLVQWPDDFSDRVNAVLKKPEAHNSGTKLPWEV